MRNHRPDAPRCFLQENIADKVGDVAHKVGDAAKGVKHKK